MDTSLPPEQQPDIPPAKFDDDAFNSIGNESKFNLIFQILNDQANVIGKQAARIRNLEIANANPNEPIRNIDFDPEFFDVAKVGDNLSITMDDQELVSRLMASTTKRDSFPTCLDSWLVYDIACVTRPGLSPLILKFQINAETCKLRVRMFDLCCVTCPGTSGSYQSGSGSYTFGLDQWAAPCSDSGSGSEYDGTNFVYLPDWVFDILDVLYDDPIIQLDDVGFCYQLLRRNVAGVETSFTGYSVYTTCTDSSCEAEAPCTCPGDLHTSGLRISGYSDTFFGQMQYDSGGGCTTPGGTTAAAAFDGTLPSVGPMNSLANCYYGQSGNPSFDNGTTRSQITFCDASLIDPGGGNPCYWLFRVQFYFDGTSNAIQINWRKYYGEDWTGTYTLTDASQPSLLTCSTGIPTTVTLEAI